TDVELADADVERAPALVDRVADRVDEVALVEEEQLGHDRHALGGLGLQHAGARAQRAGVDLGVGVEDEDPVAAALLEAAVDAGREAEVAAQVDGPGPIEL